MPRVADYNSLKTQVLQMLERQNDVEASEILFDGWVSLCEDDFWPTLRAPYLERFANFTFNSSVVYPDVSSVEYEYVPPSFVECINLADLTNGNNLDSISLTEIARYRGIPGRPEAYVIRGYTLSVYPIPSAPILMELSYYSRSEPLTPEAAANDIITRSPMIYLYGILKQAAAGYGEAENYTIWDSMQQKAIEKVNDAAISWRRGATHKVKFRV